MTQFVTSVTDRGSFRDCRRRWHLETIQRLAPKSAVAYALEFGTVIHTGLEWYYRSGRDATIMLDEYKAAWEDVDDRLARDYGGLYKMGIEEAWWEYYQLGHDMLLNYDAYDRREGWFDEVIEVNLEERAYIPILDTRRRRIRGRPLLTGRVDLVVRKGSDYWVWDHKTAASKPSYRALDVDDQGTGYCYIVWRTLGIVPRGFMYNVLLKKTPKDPKILKSTGMFSQDKSLLMTHERYLRAIHEAGHDPADYASHLAELQNRGYVDFFARDTSVRNMAQLQSFEKRVYREYRDMTAVLKDPRLAYPNPCQRNCSACSVLPICQTMEESGDTQDVISSMYYEQEPRYEVPERMRLGNSNKAQNSHLVGTT